MIEINNLIIKTEKELKKNFLNAEELKKQNER